ncbi:MAG: hypothetical protein WBR17_09615 [Paraburkholderia sp.]|uniref:hypothetical protein n=1 Tax=Paraburkholderia TaxID=1822464 RepID=UPI0038BD306E
MKKLLASAVLCLPLFAHADTDATADCQSHLSTWMKILHPGRQLDTEHAACKVWPADPSLTLAVQALPKAGNTDDEGEYDVEVLVADSKSGAIIAHEYEPAAISSDAIRFSQIDLDTARYQLTPQLRAFGVRVTYEGASRVNPYEGQALSLYVLDGHTLRRVVDNLTVENNSGEWDGNCAGTFSATTRTLAVGPANSAGYATLRVGETSKESVSKQTSSDCVSTDHPSKRTTTTLEYDGTAYRVPKALHYE